MKKLLLLSGFIISIFLLMFFSPLQKEDGNNDRFQYYIPLSKNKETIEVMYLTWENINLPNYIKKKDYNEFVAQEKLINYCFYVDSKNPKSLKFDKKIRDQFKKKKPVELTGKFYKTKQFDKTFPNILFDELRRFNELGFHPKNEEFIVFVID